VEINPQFYWGRKKTLVKPKTGELKAARKRTNGKKKPPDIIVKVWQPHY